jgi:hypothetical protein
MFKDKNDPLLGVAKAAMAKGDEHRKAVSTVNEHFGVYGRRALPLAKKAEYDLALKKVLAGEQLVVSEEAHQLDELSKQKLGKYVFKAGGEVMATKGGDKESEAKIDKRLSGMDVATKKIKRKTLEGAIKSAGATTGKLEERVLANKKDDYSPSYEKADQKKDRAKRILNKAKDKKQLDEASKAKLQNYVQKAVASQLELTTKRKGVEKQPELEKEIRKRGRGINNAKDKLEGPRGANRSYQTAPDGKMKPTKVFAKEDVNEDHDQGKTLVQQKDVYKRLLKSGKMIPKKKLEKPVKVVAEDIKTIKEEIANNLYKKYEAINEDEKQAWVDALDEEQFSILYEFYNPNVKFRTANANPLADAGNALMRGFGRMGNVLDRVNTPPNADDYSAAVSLGGKAVKSLAGAAADLMGSRSGNLNAGKPASGVAGYANKNVARPPATAPMAPKPPASAPEAPASAPVAAATAAATTAAAAPEKPAAPANKIIANPNLKDVWDNYTPAEKAERQGMTGLPAIEYDNKVAHRLKTVGVPVATAAAAAPDKQETPPVKPEVTASAPASTPAADAETKASAEPASEPAPRPSRSAPMAPKRQGSWGFGSGSGSDSAGAITNRALGAVNEEVKPEFQPRAGLDGWLTKYKAPKKKK